MNQLSLYGKNKEELLKQLPLTKSYQATQIQQWLAKGVTSFDDMTTLSKEMRTLLTEQQVKIISSTVVDKQTDPSGATKLAIELHDKQIVEAVLLVDAQGRKTACLSSQVGCAMGCTFCRTATMGLVRNLKAFEIVEQFVHLTNLGDEISNIVYMGMGEPLANLDEVIESIRYLNDKSLFNIGLRKITISTSGVVPGIEQLAKSDLPVRLAVSLVAAENSLRDEIMPINKAFNLKKLKEALINYQKVYKKRITLEYVMLSKFNTSKESSEQLARFIKNLDVVVNLIPWNPSDELKWAPPTSKEIDNFTSHLKSLNIPYTHRYSKGQKISGACGQLAVKKVGV